MFLGLLTTVVCVYWGGLQRQYVGLMCETRLQTFGEDAVFTVKIVRAFKIETYRGQKTSTGDTREMGSCDKKDLHKTWLTVCLLIKAYSDLHDVLCNNWQTGLSSGTKFLDKGRRVFEKGDTAVVLEICLGNGGKSALLNTENSHFIWFC